MQKCKLHGPLNNPLTMTGPNGFSVFSSAWKSVKSAVKHVIRFSPRLVSGGFETMMAAAIRHGALRALPMKLG